MLTVYGTKTDRTTAQQVNTLDCYTDSRFPRVRSTNSDLFRLISRGDRLVTEMGDRNCRF